MTDRDRLLACRTEEEWKWWIEGKMLGVHWEGRWYCLFCIASVDKYKYNFNCNCNECQGKIIDKEGRGGFCNTKYKSKSDRYIAGWDRLCRAGIV